MIFILLLHNLHHPDHCNNRHKVHDSHWLWEEGDFLDSNPKAKFSMISFNFRGLGRGYFGDRNPKTKFYMRSFNYHFFGWGVPLRLKFKVINFHEKFKLGGGGIIFRTQIHSQSSPWEVWTGDVDLNTYVQSLSSTWEVLSLSFPWEVLIFMGLGIRTQTETSFSQLPASVVCWIPESVATNVCLV